jgi:ubiquitin C-terminal hydrolase
LEAAAAAEEEAAQPQQNGLLGLKQKMTNSQSPNKNRPPQTGPTPQLPNKEESKDSSEYKKKMALINGPIINMDYCNSDKYGMEESLFSSLKDLFEAIAMHDSRTGVISPSRFLDVLKREYEIFRAPMHQDAHEFLNLFLNNLVENIDRYTKTLEASHSASGSSRSDPMSDSESSSTTDISSTHLKRLATSSKFLHEIFEGTLTSETRCMTCEHTSFRDEAFLDLSVDLDVFSSVTSCLSRFSDEEMLRERNKFHCDRCGGLQEAEKRMRLKNLPKVLALHLKRFKYTEDLQRLQKLFHHVSYPAHLRLNNTTNNSQEEQKVYELYGIVVHIGGGPYHGHYVSIVKTQDHGWLLFDDENVEPVETSFVYEFFGGEQSLACAYVLFYRESEDPTLFIDEDPEPRSQDDSKPNLTLVTGADPEDLTPISHHITAPASAIPVEPATPSHSHFANKVPHVVSSPNLWSLNKKKSGDVHRDTDHKHLDLDLDDRLAKERAKVEEDIYNKYKGENNDSPTDNLGKFSLSGSFQRFKASSKSLKVKSKSGFFNSGSVKNDREPVSQTNSSTLSTSASSNRLSGQFANYSMSTTPSSTTQTLTQPTSPTFPTSAPGSQATGNGSTRGPADFRLSGASSTSTSSEYKPLPALPSALPSAMMGPSIHIPTSTIKSPLIASPPTLVERTDREEKGEKKKDKRSMWGLGRRKEYDYSDSL